MSDKSPRDIVAGIPVILSSAAARTFLVSNQGAVLADHLLIESGSNLLINTRDSLLIR
jgi:hypothetical protein